MLVQTVNLPEFNEADQEVLRDQEILESDEREGSGIFLLYTLGTPPSKSDKTLYIGIYLPTFREGTNFIIKLLVSCLGALTGPRESPPWYL